MTVVPAQERKQRGSRGRGSSSRGRDTARRTKCGFTPSTLAWEEVNAATDAAPPSLPFTRTSQSTVNLGPTASPVQFLDHFVDEDIVGLVSRWAAATPISKAGSEADREAVATMMSQSQQTQQRYYAMIKGRDVAVKGFHLMESLRRDSPGDPASSGRVPYSDG